MKKIFKRKSSVPRQPSQDVVSLIGQIQQQLVSLEQKVDTLIGRSPERSERPFQRKSFDRPFRSFDRSHGHRERGPDFGSGTRNFTQAICAECGKECEVPFKPSGDRPVYCRDCFARRKDSGQFKGRRDNRFDENQELGGRKKHFMRRKKGRE